MLRHSEYSFSTDVWSFGVLLWEIAAQATPDLLRQEGIRQGPVFIALLRCLEEGRRLKLKEEWPAAWYKLMFRCMQQNPGSRPLFSSILRLLEDNAGDA